MDVEPEEKILTIFLIYENREAILELSEYDTVEILQIEVHRIFDIPPHEQRIDGWKNIPESDNTILQMCVDLHTVVCLVINKVDNNLLGCENVCDASYDNDDELELEASISFFNKISREHLKTSLTFHICRLADAITEVCFVPLEQRKILLLYLHNEDDAFSSVFFKNLKNPNVVEILKKHFFILGWDVGNTKYQNALVAALNRCSEISNLVQLIKSKVAAALTITSINNCLTVSSCLRGSISDKDFLETLKQVESFLLLENEQEQTLDQLHKETKTENDIGSVNFHNLMCDMLGDRDYDSFEYNEHDHLKEKIAFAFKGPPQEEKGYDEKDWKKVDSLYKVILENSNEVAKYKDKVEISFIYNCVEPLPSEKISRAKKYKDYNPNTDIMPLPIFVLRKCRGSENPCRIFIDDTGRTYNTWEEYITRNKLHQCEMILPQNGRYEVNSTGEVLLEKHLSPACGVDAKLLQGADYASVAGGLISGGIFLTATVSPIVAPAVLIAGTFAGIGVGIYSVGRSVYALYDRGRHKESLSFLNSEARGAYLNIVAGSLGFVGAGAHLAVSQLAMRGVNIGKGAGAVVNTISFANIGVSGASVLNSGYDVLDQWFNENQTPSLLTIVQLSSSVLFFGNAVYNFKMCSTIVEETQAKTLQDYQSSLRSNRHRKAFVKLLKETVRQNDGNAVRGRAEVISTIRNIHNKDEVFAILTRSNKEMNKRGIKFAAIDGEIKLNGIKIDFNEFMGMNKKDVKTFLSSITKSDPTPIETVSTRTEASNILTNLSFQDINMFANYAVRLLGGCTSDIKSKVIEILAKLLSKFTVSVNQVLNDILPNCSKYLRLLDMIVQYFGRIAEISEIQYQQWKETGDDRYYNPIFQYVDMDKVKRYIRFFEYAVKICYGGPNLIEESIKNLLTYFHNWLAQQILEYEEEKERDTRRRGHSATAPTTEIRCKICGGYYYKQNRS